MKSKKDEENRRKLLWFGFNINPAGAPNTSLNPSPYPKNYPLKEPKPEPKPELTPKPKDDWWPNIPPIIPKIIIEKPPKIRLGYSEPYPESKKKGKSRRNAGWIVENPFPTARSLFGRMPKP